MNGFSALDTNFEDRLRLGLDDGELPKDTDLGALTWLVTATMHSMGIRAGVGASRKTCGNSR
jgi:hypothetical protein